MTGPYAQMPLPRYHAKNVVISPTLLIKRLIHTKLVPKYLTHCLSLSFSFKQNNFRSPTWEQMFSYTAHKTPNNPPKKVLCLAFKRKHNLSSERKAIFKKPVFSMVRRKRRAKHICLIVSQLLPCCIIISAVGVSAWGRAWTSQGEQL